ncbi:MAG: HAMP domain-containing histidine kinase [Acidobacteria bacterium]|nr:HAMP domain-containing histidine kinase [Acidobacteriota bacterium]
MSLRARLLVGLVALAAAGLLIADAATYVSLRSFLSRRVDQQLEAARIPVGRALVSEVRGELGLGIRRPRVGGPPLPLGAYGELRNASGGVLATVSFDVGETASPPPDLRNAAAPGGPRTFTTGAADGSSLRYRVLATPLPGDRGVLFVAIPLREVSQTLGRLVLVEGAVTAVVLAGLAALAWWVVRLGLRPLEEIGSTAGAIAAGDLSRRVELADERTEVGRLGVSLNAMLGRIEEAFGKQKASEERLRRFLSDASHELRTPLTSIRGYAELFRRGASDRAEDLAMVMRRIEDEAARMGVLVDDLLLLARIDEGRPLQRAPVDLAAVAADAAADARVVDPGREIALESSGPVIVTGDEVRLRQVAGNLLSNAVTHTPAGTPVEVRVAIEGAGAVLEVTDHGPGLAPGEAERVFDRFYRSEPGRARDEGAGGAGLGLSIAAAIAEAHGGRIEVRTAPGEGTCFRVSLPLAAPEESAPEESAPEESAPDGA